LTDRKLEELYKNFKLIAHALLLQHKQNEAHRKLFTLLPNSHLMLGSCNSSTLKAHFRTIQEQDMHQKQDTGTS
jgi:hypothetical protein